MALFTRKKTEKVIFDKDLIIKEILKEAPEMVPSWKIMSVDNFGNEPFSGKESGEFIELETNGKPLEEVYIPLHKSKVLECDLLAIRSVNIQKEVSVTNNPFSNYRSIVPSTYQIVVPIYIVEEVNNMDSYPSYGWRAMCANSADILFRKLEQEE